MPYGVSAATWSHMSPEDRAAVQKAYAKKQSAAKAAAARRDANARAAMAASSTAQSQGLRNGLGYAQFLNDPPGYAKNDRAWVTKLQKEMNRVGLHIAVDGVWGPQTANALRIYNTQKMVGKGPGALPYRAGDYVRAQQVYMAKVKAERDRVTGQASKLEKSLRNAVKAGDMSQLDMQLALARFWSKLGGGSFGQFTAQAAQARKTQAELEDFQRKQNQNRAFIAASQKKKTGLALAWDTISEAAPRFYHAFDRAENQQLAQDMRDKKNYKGIGGRFALAYRSTIERPFTAFNAGLLAATRTAGLNPANDFARKMAESVDTKEERRELTLRGMLESPGQRYAREFYGRHDIERQASQEAQRRGLTGRDRSAFVKAEFERKREQYLLSGRRPDSGFGRSSYKGTPISMIGDTFANVVVDPLNVVGAAIPRLTIVASAKGAAKIAASTAGKAMIERASLQVMKAIARNDTSLLLKTVPGLSRKTGEEVVQALLDPRAAMRWLGKVEATTARGTYRAQSALMATQELRAAGEMTQDVAANILKTALGNQWQPVVSLKARGAGLLAGGAAKGLGLDPTLAINAITRMSVFNSAAKSVSFSHLLRRKLEGGKAGYVGRLVTKDPRLSGLSRALRDFAAPDELEGLPAELKALRKKQIGLVSQGPRKGQAKFATRNSVEDWNFRQMESLENLATLPSGAIRDSLQSRFDTLQVDVLAQIEDKLQGLTPAQLEDLAKDNEYLEAKRHVLQASALKTFGTDSYTKFASALFDLDRAVRKFADIKLPPEMLRAIGAIEKDIITARKISAEAYTATEQRFMADIEAFEAFERRALPAEIRQGILQRFGQRALRAPLAFADMVPSKNTINIEDIDERVTYVQDFARSLGAPFYEVAAAATEAWKAGTQYDNAVDTVNDLVQSLERNFMVRQGLTEAEVGEYMAVRRASLNQWLLDNGGIGTRAQLGFGRRRTLNRIGIEQPAGEFAPEGGPRLYGRVYDPETDSLVTRTTPQAVSQAQNVVATPSLDEVRLYVKVAKQQRLSPTLMGAMRKGPGEALRVTGAMARGFAYPLNRIWKFSVLVSPRYILRVAGIEERLRFFQTQNFEHSLAIGAVTRRQNNYMMRHTGMGFTNYRAIGMDDVPDFFAHRKFAGAGELTILDRDDKGFVENWWHLVNHQLNPDQDPLAHILLPTLHREGTQEWTDDIDDAIAWLKSNDGRPYFGHYRSLNGDVSTPEEVVENWRQWAQSIIPTDELAQRRLEGLVDMRTLGDNKAWQPDEIYGRPFESTTRTLAKDILSGDVRASGQQAMKIIGRLVMESPTTGMNRQSFAFIEYRKELDALLDAGIDFQEASRLANGWAVQRTNQIMYDASRRSRFAAAVEPYFPFQAAREESVRVWARIAKENPAKAAATVAKFARLFNAGEEEGVFYKDEYGDYRMRIPTGPLAAASRFLGDHLPEWAPFEDQFEQIGKDPMFKDMEMSFRLKDLLLIQQSELPLVRGSMLKQYALGAVLPQPGGPIWQVGLGTLLNNHRHLYPQNELFQGWLDPYNNVQNWMNLGGNHWRYFFGALSGREWNNDETNRLLNQAQREFYFRHGRFPTPEELEQIGKSLFLTKGLMAFFFPAGTRTQFESQQRFASKLKEYEDYTAKFGGNAIALLVANHPELTAYVVSSKYDPELAPYRNAQGKVDWAKLERENPTLWQAIRFDLEDDDYKSVFGKDKWADFVRARRDQDPASFQKAAAYGTDKAKMMSEFYTALEQGQLGGADARAEAMHQWEQKWKGSDVFADRKDEYIGFVRLDGILAMTEGQRKHDLLAQLRIDYGWSKSRLDSLIQNRSKEHDAFDGYLTARTTVELDDMWRGEAAKEGMSMETFVATRLTPHEANNWLAWRMASAEDYDDWKEANRLRGILWGGGYEDVKPAWGGKADVLTDKGFSKAVDQATKEWDARKKNVRTEISRLYHKINGVNAQLEHIYDQFAANKAAHKWDPGLGDVYGRLKGQRNALYAQIRGLQNSVYNAQPLLNSVSDEVKFMHAMQDHLAQGGKLGSFDFQGAGFRTRPSDEETRWSKMPPRVQRDYLNDLRSSLSAGKYQWDWLTDFQKNLMRDILGVGTADIERWKKNGPSDSGGKSGWGGWRKWNFKKWEWHMWGHKLGDGFGELAFSLEMFKQYNKRGDLKEPTDELNALKRIGNNPALRADFLKHHPRVREWIRLGPMMQMPVAMAEMVRFIMQKYHRWEDFDGPSAGPSTYDELAEVAFAKTMLAKYTKRVKGEQAPKAYELWQQMPTGKAKADYINQHPEIERWLSRGPMANMPDEYQEVVRDIMNRYGLWEQRQDPLGALISRYYELPSYARQAFLEQHPEVMAYWRALRSGPDRVLFDLAQRYFALTDPTAKRSFLESHPELQGYFVDERQRRYEQFLKNVAQYLGHYPDLANHYLADQTRFLKQLVDKYGEKPLVAHEVGRVNAGVRGDRTRQAAPARRRDV